MSTVSKLWQIRCDKTQGLLALLKQKHLLSNNTKMAVEQVEDTLGIEYLAFLLEPGILSRVDTFVRFTTSTNTKDPCKLYDAFGKHVETAYSFTQRAKNVPPSHRGKYYRGLAITERNIKTIIESGMKSNAARNGGEYYQAVKSIFTNGIDTITNKHLKDTTDSPLLSFTTDITLARWVTTKQRKNQQLDRAGIYLFQFFLPRISLIDGSSTEDESFAFFTIPAEAIQDHKEAVPYDFMDQYLPPHMRYGQYENW